MHIILKLLGIKSNDKKKLLTTISHFLNLKKLVHSQGFVYHSLALCFKIFFSFLNTLEKNKLSETQYCVHNTFLRLVFN